MISDDYSRLKDIVERRRSVRTFTGKPLTKDQSNLIVQSLTETRSPFGGHVASRLATVDALDEFRPSTYGVIRHARSYILIGYNPADKLSALSAGYIGERAVLAATDAGLGTCWIAGTFKFNSFTQAADFGEETPLQIVIPVGEAACRRSFLDSLMHTMVGSAHRKPYNQLFFSSPTLTPLNESSIFYKPLEMMRLAPSAVNIQTWRAVVDDQNCSVSFYASTLNHHGCLNMGIGLCHFALACESLGIPGKLEVSDSLSAVKDWMSVARFR